MAALQQRLEAKGNREGKMEEQAGGAQGSRPGGLDRRPTRQNSHARADRILIYGQNSYVQAEFPFTAAEF